MGANASREGASGSGAASEGGPTDLYFLLGIETTASQDEIKKAFRKAVRLPDHLYIRS